MACLSLLFSLSIAACSSQKQFRIAFIPQTEGTLIWESAHVGAEEAARHTGTFIYWNAPSREDDVESQIAIVDRVTSGNFQGLVLAPDQTLSLITPVRRALARGIPTVIIGSPLPIPAGGNLAYILNDDVAGGRLAARRVGDLLHGSGSVAVLGVNPDLTGVMIRERAFEESLAENYPDIRIVEKRMGSFNVPHEQQVAEDTLKAHRDLDVIVALMSTTVDGSVAALANSPGRGSIKIIAFDIGGWPPFNRSASLDCVIQEDTRSMGQQAVNLIRARMSGAPVSARITLSPQVITRANANSAAVQRMVAQDWTLGHWSWSSIQ